MQISQLYHVISEVEREARQQANEKYRAEFRRLERGQIELSKQLMKTMSVCVAESNLDSDDVYINNRASDIINLVRQHEQLDKATHDVADKVVQEAERVAQMLLNKRGVRIVVEQRLNVDLNPISNESEDDFIELHNTYPN